MGFLFSPPYEDFGATHPPQPVHFPEIVCP
jgi:hypothetical protein